MVYLLTILTTAVVLTGGSHASDVPLWCKPVRGIAHDMVECKMPDGRSIRMRKDFD